MSDQIDDVDEEVDPEYWEILVQTLKEVRDEIEEKFNEKKLTFGVYGRRQSFKTSKWYILEKIESLIVEIEGYSSESLIKVEGRLEEFDERLTEWKDESLDKMFDDYNDSPSAYVSLLLYIDEIGLFLKNNCNPDGLDNLRKRLNEARRGISGLLSNVDREKKRCDDLNKTIQVILNAKSASLSMPETLDSLEKMNNSIKIMFDDSSENSENISKMTNEVLETNNFLRNKKEEVESLLLRCEDALRASTGVGLASAFERQANELKRSSRWWMALLVLTLGVFMAIGWVRVNDLFELMRRSDVDSSLIVLNAFMSAVLVGAPAWLAWIAAKRVSHLFRLIEDYSFKSAVSRAYEGYSREAGKFEDSDFEQRLMDSAMTRFDEAPLRFVEKNEKVHPLIEFVDLLFSKKGTKEERKEKGNLNERKSFEKSDDKGSLEE